jgi:hypothetical protein
MDFFLVVVDEDWVGIVVVGVIFGMMVDIVFQVLVF